MEKSSLICVRNVSANSDSARAREINVPAGPCLIDPSTIHNPAEPQGFERYTLVLMKRGDHWNPNTPEFIDVMKQHHAFVKTNDRSWNLLDRLFCYITLEVGLLVGALFIAGGLGTSIYAVGLWGARHFGNLDYSHTMRLLIPASLLLTLGAQTVFASFFLSVLGLRRR